MFSVGTATGYRLDDWGLGVRFLGGGPGTLLHCAQIGSGAHPASYPMGTGGSFPKVKHVWHNTSTPSICLHGAVLS